GKRYGVGTASPFAKLTVQGDATIAPDEPLFEVKNAAGDVIFAVYENEVKVNFKETAKGVKGGFAVGGLSGTKANPVEYLRITPDSVRIYINDTAVKGVKGGFAVGGLSGTKGGNQYFKLDDESASIYLKQPAKGVKGGFAVGGLSGTKGSEDYLTIERDSARMYINDAVKGVKGGFAVGGLSGTKAGANFLDLTPENYFIGHNSGMNTVTGVGNEGRYNSFFGYEAGMYNENGYQNIFIGYKAGKSNISGYNNIFIGDSAAISNTTGYSNVVLGSKAAKGLSWGHDNVVLGYKAGESLTTGDYNIFIGNNAGSKLTNQRHNVFIGYESGRENIGGYRNVFVGFRSGTLNVDGTANTYIGQFAGDENLGSTNTFLGYWAGGGNNIGDANVFLGYRTGMGSTGNGNVFIGTQVGESATGSNMLYIDNSTTSSPLIYGEFDNQIVNINGDFGVSGNSEVSGDFSVSGNIGINTTTPSYDLHINATDATISLGGYELGRLTGGTGLDNDVIPFTGSASGFDLGNNNATEHWGDVVATLYVTYAKGEQFKSGEKMNIDVDLLKALEPVSYISDESRGKQLQYGFTIESLSKVAPAALVTSDTDYDEETNQYITTKSENPGINYNALLPVVVSFMQQQQQVIETQSKEIQNHAQEIEALKQANKELKTLIESLK
ncbi:MAG: hypothetical protein C0599_18510, partial [Salinivirgaceae bacterium]